MRLTVGRDESCDIRVDQQHVSPQHAELTLDDAGRWCIEDVGSINGVRVNGGRVYTRPMAIHAADLIELGSVRMTGADLVRIADEVVAAKSIHRKTAVPPSTE